jgi:hypothetical protein
VITLEVQRAFVHIVPDVAYAIEEAVVRLLYRGIYKAGGGGKRLAQRRAKVVREDGPAWWLESGVVGHDRPRALSGRVRGREREDTVNTCNPSFNLPPVL